MKKRDKKELGAKNAELLSFLWDYLFANAKILAVFPNTSM